MSQLQRKNKISEAVKELTVNQKNIQNNSLKSIKVNYPIMDIQAPTLLYDPDYRVGKLTFDTAYAGHSPYSHFGLSKTDRLGFVLDDPYYIFEEVIFENIDETTIPYINVVPVIKHKLDGYFQPNASWYQYSWFPFWVKLTNNTDGVTIFDGVSTILQTSPIMTADQIAQYSTMSVARKKWNFSVYYTHLGDQYRIDVDELGSVDYNYNYTPSSCIYATPGSGDQDYDQYHGGASITTMSSSGMTFIPKTYVYNHVRYFTVIDTLSCGVEFTQHDTPATYSVLWSDLQTIYVSGVQYKMIAGDWVQQGNSSWAVDASEITNVDNILHVGYVITTNARHTYDLWFNYPGTTEGDSVRVEARGLYPGHNYTYLRNYGVHPNKNYSDEIQRQLIVTDTNRPELTWIKLGENKFRCMITYKIAGTLPCSEDEQVINSVPVYNFTFDATTGTPQYTPSGYTTKDVITYRPKNGDIEYKFQFWGSPLRAFYANYKHTTK